MWRFEINKICVKIIEVVKSGSVALVKFESCESSVNSANKNAESNANPAIFSAVLLDFSQNLAQGSECNVVFKESEVMIATLDSRISARNRFVSQITKIECDDIFARIFLDFLGQSVTALITKEASVELNLKEGENALWFVKANEIMVEFR